MTSPARCVLLFFALLFARPAAAATNVELYLEVSLNGANLGIIAAFTERPDGGLAIAPSELAEIGIAGQASAIAGDGLVELRRLSGLTYRYDAASQSIAFTSRIDRLMHHDLDAAGTGAPLLAESGRGAVVNYALFGEMDNAWRANAAASFDARLFSESGLLAQSGLVKTGTGFIRLDTTFTRSDPVEMVTWQAGDFVSGGLAWTRPLRMAGVRVARNFGLRPDLVTMPLPAYSGSAAVPSTVDVYTGGARIYSGTVPAGPFSIANLPVITGAGTARVVVTDALGRETASDLPFFADAGLLKQGLADFSMEAGFPRLSYGVLSADYAGPAVSASLRYGVNDHLTAEAHAEIGGGIWNGGAGFVAPAGRLGMMSAAVAASVGDHAGVAINGGVDLALGKVGVRVRSMRAFGDYADVASATASDGQAVPRAVDQASLSLPLFGGAAALSLSRIATDDTSTVTAFSYSRGVFDAGTFYVSAFQALDGKRNAGILAGFSRPLPGGTNFALSATGGEHGRATAEISRGENSQPGSVGWDILASTDMAGTRPEIRGRASYRASAARIAGSGVLNAAGVGGSGEMSGAIVFAGGEMFAANRIDDAFAVVDAGAPDVEVFSENRPAGRTNRKGKLLVTGLHAYERNHLAIAPDDLPLDVEAAETKVTVVPADRTGVAVSFGVKPVGASAVVVLRDAAGAFLPAGATGTLADGGTFIVGYDGQAYLTNLGADNTATVDLGDGRTCVARFAYADDGVQPTIDGVRCL